MTAEGIRVARTWRRLRLPLYGLLCVLAVWAASLAGCGGGRSVGPQRAAAIVRARLDDRFDMMKMNLLEVQPAAIWTGRRRLEVWEVRMECDCEQGYVLTAWVDRATGRVVNWYAKPDDR